MGEEYAIAFVCYEIVNQALSLPDTLLYNSKYREPLFAIISPSLQIHIYVHTTQLQADIPSAPASDVSDDLAARIGVVTTALK